MNQIPMSSPKVEDRHNASLRLEEFGIGQVLTKDDQIHAASAATRTGP